jgi:hypothetical protein
MVVSEVPVVESRQQDLPLQLFQPPPVPNSTSHALAFHASGDILREHDPSLGKTPDPGGDLEPVILTSSRIPSE